MRALVAAALLGAVFFAAFARPPRRSVAKGVLSALMAGAVLLYAVGGIVAAVLHQLLIAWIACGLGIAAFSLALWLTRFGSAEPPSDGRGSGEEPPRGPSPTPDDQPLVDWDRFEREFADYAQSARPVALRDG